GMRSGAALIADRVEGDVPLAAALGLKPGEQPIWVCGSTGAGEEEIVVREFRKLLSTYRKLRLSIVPRKPERFAEGASLSKRSSFELVRRSTGDGQPLEGNPVLLG